MPQTTGRAERTSEGMGGLAKGLAIIEAFATHGVLNIADAARASGATRAAARRCLITLTELGYVEQSGREFRPLARLRELGGATSKRDQLARLAQPLLERARDQLTQSVSLAVLANPPTFFIARPHPPPIISTRPLLPPALPTHS